MPKTATTTATIEHDNDQRQQRAARDLAALQLHRDRLLATPALGHSSLFSVRFDLRVQWSRSLARWFVVPASFAHDWASFCVLGRAGRGRIVAVHQGEEDRHEGQRAKGRQQQAADHSAAQRRILLAAIAQAQRHRAPCR